MSFVFVPPSPKSPILDFDPHELATAVRGTIGTSTPNIADLASDFVLYFNISGHQFMERGESILKTLSNNDPVALEKLTALRTSPPESLKFLLSPNSRSPSISNNFQELTPVVRDMIAERSLDTSSSTATISDHPPEISEQEELDEPFDFPDEDSSTSDELGETDLELASSDHGPALGSLQHILLTNAADEDIVIIDAISQVNIPPSSVSLPLEEQSPVSTEDMHHPAEFVLCPSTQLPISAPPEGRQRSSPDSNAEPRLIFTDHSISSNPIQPSSDPPTPGHNGGKALKVAADVENVVDDEHTPSDNESTNSSAPQTPASEVFLVEESSYIEDQSLQLFGPLLSLPKVAEEPNDVDNDPQQDLATEPYGHYYPENENTTLQTTVAHDTEVTATSHESEILCPVTHPPISPESVHNSPSSSATSISTTSSTSRITPTDQVSVIDSQESLPHSQIPSDPRFTGRSTDSVGTRPPPASEGNEDIPDKVDVILGALSPILVDFSFEHQDSHDHSVDDVATPTLSIPLVLDRAGGKTDLDEDDGADTARLTTPSSSDAQARLTASATQAPLSLCHDSGNLSSRIVGDSDTFSVSMLTFIEQTLSSNLRNPKEPSIYGRFPSLDTPFSAYNIEDSSHTEITSPSGHRDLGLSSPSASSYSNPDGPASHFSLPILVPVLPTTSGTDSATKMSIRSMHGAIPPSEIPRHVGRIELPFSPTLAMLAPAELSSSATTGDIPVLRITVAGDHIKSGTEVKLPTSPSLLSDTALVSDIATSPTLALSISDGSSAAHLHPKFAASPSLEHCYTHSIKPCNVGSWTNAGRQTLRTVEEVSLTASCSPSNTAPRHAQQDNSVSPGSPSRTVIIHSEDQFIMTPDVLPGISLPNDSNLHYGSTSPVCQPTPDGFSTEHNPMFLLPVDSGSPMSSPEYGLVGAEDKNTPLIAVEPSPRVASGNDENMVSFSQGPIWLEEANFEVGSVPEPRPVIFVDLLDSNERFNIDIYPRSESAEKPGIHGCNAAELSSEKNEFSLPIIPLDRSLSQEISSSLESLSFDLPANPGHIIAEPSPIPTVLTSPRRSSRATPRTLWPVSEYLHDEGRTSAVQLDNDKESGKRKPRVTVSGSKTRRDDLVTPTHVDVAIQTDLDCQRRLSHIQTHTQVGPGPSGASPLSALLPSRSVVLGVFQKLFPSALPKDASNDNAPSSTLPPRPRVDVTSGGLLPSFHGPLSAISRDGEV